jgi:hypothetical protein
MTHRPPLVVLRIPAQVLLLEGPIEDAAPGDRILIRRRRVGPLHAKVGARSDLTKVIYQFVDRRPGMCFYTPLTLNTQETSCVLE